MTTETRDRIKQHILAALSNRPLQNIDVRIDVKQSLREIPEMQEILRDAFFTNHIDKMLQRLRKEGLIYFSKSKWHLASRKKCEHCDGKGYVSETSDSQQNA